MARVCSKISMVCENIGQVYQILEKKSMHKLVRCAPKFGSHLPAKLIQVCHMFWFKLIKFAQLSTTFTTICVNLNSIYKIQPIL